MKSLNDDLQMRSDWLLPLCGGAERIKRDGRKAHPTQKPEALLYRVMLASSSAGDLVLDPFSGSGTTVTTATTLNRHYLGIDLSEDYVNLGLKRLKKRQDELDTTLFASGTTGP